MDRSIKGQLTARTLMTTISLTILATLLSLGCSLGNSDSSIWSRGANSAERIGLTRCPASARGADACIQIYKPVCGYFYRNSDACSSHDDCRSTFSNSCHACREESVEGYKEGSCEGGEVELRIEER